MDHATLYLNEYSSTFIFLRSRPFLDMKYREVYSVLLFGLLYLGIPLCLPLTPSSFAAENRPFRPGERLWGGFTSACVLSLLLPVGIVRDIVGAIILWYIQREYPKSATGHTGRDYLIAINITLTALKFVDFVYLRVPEDTAHRVNTSGQSIETGEGIRVASYWERLKWAAGLFSTLRGVGWNWRVKNVEDVSRDTKRWAFVSRQILGFIYSYMAVDFLGHFLSQHSVLQSRSEADYFALPLLTQAQLAWMMAFRSGFEMSLGYYLVAGMTVALGVYDAQAWPPMFGSFFKGYSIRNIWGKCWHQNLRRNFETYGNLLCTQLGIPRGSTRSAYLKLYFSFLFSAYIHHVGAMNNPYTPAMRYQFWFFLMQPVAITIEDIFCASGEGKRVRDREVTNKENLNVPTAQQKAVGYVWVFGFLSISLRYMAAYVVAAGFAGIEHPLTKRFSLARYIFGD